jgi:tetratricopeptide (TPR) repeat protein
VRKLLAVFLVAAAAGAAAQERPVAAQLAQGIASYKAGEAAVAVRTLSAVASDLVKAGSGYLETGVFPALPEMEAALVYLALAHFRLGDEDAARETLLRLHAAERILPTYAVLDIGRDAADLEALNAALLPSTPLPRNVFLVAEDPAAPLPPLVPRTTRAPVTQTAAEEQAERQEILDALSRVALKPIRVAEAPAPVPPSAPQPVVTAPPPAAPIPAPAAPAPAPVVTKAVPVAATPVPARELLLTLRDAESAATGGNLEAAIRSYASVATAPGAPRDVLAAAAVGLYRTAAFRDAVAAFQRLGTFRRGEEDLRYYYAVSLYESGRYVEARTELACALPFLIETEDVARNRYRIEMFAQQARY